jgi:hypothetical protein
VKGLAPVVILREAKNIALRLMQGLAPKKSKARSFGHKLPQDDNTGLHQEEDTIYLIR